MNRLLKEPLLHFLIAGAALFAAYTWLNGGAAAFDGDPASPVRVSAVEVVWLGQTWVRQHQRPPDADELRGLVSGYVEEELLCREALELGLDKDDTIVRRRLAQKMEFFIRDTARTPDPSDDELRRFFEANLERFLTPGRISFTQAFFNPDGEGETASTRAVRALERLSRVEAPAVAWEVGDRSLLEAEYVAEDRTAVANLFGADFANAVFAIEPGAWNGPVESGYGLHLVRVTERQGARAPDFAEVRDKVLAEWRQQQDKHARDLYFRELERKYGVVVDDEVADMIGPVALGKEHDR